MTAAESPQTPAEISEEQVVGIAQEVWESFLGLELLPAGTGDLEAEGTTTSAVVQITGAWEGSVLLTCPSTLARAAAGAMFDSDEDDLSEEEVADALGELVNMVGGNIKSLLPSPSQLSIPTVTVGDHYSLHVLGATAVHDVLLDCRDSRLRIIVWRANTP